MSTDGLERARHDTDRHEWGRALSGWRELALEDLTEQDLVACGMTEFLTGHPEQAVRALQTAHHRQIDRGAAAEALHSAFLVATIFDLRGQASLFQGWLGRAQRQLALIEDAVNEAVGRGYVAMLEQRRALGAGRFEEMAPLADEIAEIGQRHQAPDLIAMGLLTQGRLRIYGGEVAGGLALLDEAVACVLAAEVSPLIAGFVLCTAIDGCQEVGAIDRLGQWTDHLRTWCVDQPGLTVFTGAAALHHGQLLVLRGNWDEALEELVAAAERYLMLGQRGSAGIVERERGDLLRLRGRWEEAGGAYREATALGCDPHPGLAMLWLAQGRTESASAAIRRRLTEVSLPAQRGLMLPAAIEVLLTGGDIAYAEGLAQELDLLAEVTGCAPIAAAAARAHAQVEVAGGDAAAGVPYARKAIHLWSDVGAPFEVARSRVVLARALDALGDARSAEQERQEATLACTALGAVLPGTASPAAVRESGPLTAREVEVLSLVAVGATNRQIAHDLTLSERTVARHLSNIFGKLGVTSRTAAASYAYQHHLT